jgi:hypothetical protein
MGETDERNEDGKKGKGKCKEKRRRLVEKLITGVGSSGWCAGWLSGQA